MATGSKKLLFAFLAGLLGVGGLLSPALIAQDRSDIKAQPANASGLTAGKAVFQQNCSFCHGRDGSGASGPDLIRSTLVSHDVDGDLIGQVVHNGRLEKGMPAFQLPDDQVHQIAEFLHAQAKLASTVASRIPTEYPLEKLLVGNSEAGKSYFNGAGKCAQCHSSAGDFAHIASKYKPLELQSRIAFPYGAKPTASVTDSSGHRFTGDVVYSDEFLITVQCSDGTLRTWNRQTANRGAAKIEIHDPLAAHVALLTQYTDADIHNLFAYLETLK
jgi:cytochrome c oxidase cbb3-type subunit 3